MIYQSDYPGKIKEFGCLVFSLIHVAEKMCGKVFRADHVVPMYKHMIKQGYISEDCYVNNHAAVINEALSYMIEPDIRAKYVGADYLDKKYKTWGEHEGQYIILQTKTEKVPGHFICLDYNPYENGSRIISIRSVRYYETC